MIRMHPSIVSQLNESYSRPAAVASDGIPQPPPTAPSLPYGDAAGRLPSLSEIIRQKVDDLLGIEVIKALSSSDSSKIADLAKVMNPPRETSLDEIKRYHDIFYHDAPNQVGSTWVDVIKEALPVIGEGFKGVNEAMKNKPQRGMQNVREGNTGCESSIKPIQLEIAGDTTESGDNSKESGAIGTTEQQNH